MVSLWFNVPLNIAFRNSVPDQELRDPCNKKKNQNKQTNKQLNKIEKKRSRLEKEKKWGQEELLQILAIISKDNYFHSSLGRLYVSSFKHRKDRTSLYSNSINTVNSISAEKERAGSLVRTVLFMQVKENPVKTKADTLP